MPPGALPSLEEPDYHLLVEAGRAQGLSFDVRYWDDPALPSEGYDAAIVRSCWDYIERADEFIETLAAHERAGLRLFNRADVVRWNFRKTYLNNLGALAIPTFWSEKIDARAVAQAFDALDAAEIVIKPQIGGGSRNTVRLQRNAWSEADLREAPAGRSDDPTIPALDPNRGRAVVVLVWRRILARDPQSAEPWRLVREYPEGDAIFR